MRQHSMWLAAAAVALTGACSKTENGDLVVKRPADVNVTTTQDTLHMPKMGSKLDTINSPVVGTQKETVVVNKPVVGTEKRVVKVPVIRKP
jgi:hypothetical protein